MSSCFVAVQYPKAFTTGNTDIYPVASWSTRLRSIRNQRLNISKQAAHIRIENRKEKKKLDKNISRVTLKNINRNCFF